MKNYSIYYYDKATIGEVLSIPQKLQARYFRLCNLILEFGLDLNIPNLKFKEKQLFELYLGKDKDFEYICYLTQVHKNIIILYLSKKNAIENKHNLEIVQLRLREVRRWLNIYTIK